jgi:hypothetical protein
MNDWQASFNSLNTPIEDESWFYNFLKVYAKVAHIVCLAASPIIVIVTLIVSLPSEYPGTFLAIGLAVAASLLGGAVTSWLILVLIDIGVSLRSIRGRVKHAQPIPKVQAPSVGS